MAYTPPPPFQDPEGKARFRPDNTYVLVRGLRFGLGLIGMGLFLLIPFIDPGWQHDLFTMGYTIILFNLALLVLVTYFGFSVALARMRQQRTRVVMPKIKAYVHTVYDYHLNREQLRHLTEPAFAKADTYVSRPTRIHYVMKTTGEPRASRVHLTYSAEHGVYLLRDWHARAES